MPTVHLSPAHLLSRSAGYPGSKAGAGVWQRIISQMPVHANYFEPFLGHGAVMLRKKPAPGLNVGCDVDGRVIEWWEKMNLTRRRRGAERNSLCASAPLREVLHCDALQILSSHPAMTDPNTLVYLDPPYLRSVRTRDLYDHEFGSEDQHRRLLVTIKSLQCKVMLSGYDSPLYRRLLSPQSSVLSPWRHISYSAMTRGGVRREFLWMNFPAGLPLHDCRFVGDGFRERERINRKRDRWRRKFESMPAAERQVIREALDSVHHGDTEARRR